MKRLYSFIGIVVLFATLHTNAYASSHELLYDKIRSVTQNQAMRTAVEQSLKVFLPKVFDFQPQLTEDNIEQAREMDLIKLCQEYHNLSETKPCSDLAEQINATARREANIRALGRELQLIASGYELPLSEHSGRLLAIAPRLPSIIRIWQATNDPYVTPVVESKVRTANFSDEARVLMDQLGSLLDEQNTRDKNAPEILAAIVHRYRYGFKQVEHEPDTNGYPLGTCSSTHEDADGTELQYLKVRWCSIEEKMQAIYADIAATAFIPPLRYGEVVVFPSYVLDNGVVVWARAAFDENVADVGLEWEISTEPVLPSLDCSQSVGNPYECNTQKGILGGTYPDEPPPEPREESKLCAGNFAQQGYLCSPLPAQDCPVDPMYDDEGNEIPRPGSETGAIVLTRCDPENSRFMTDKTYWGPDACQRGGWRVDTPRITKPDGTVVDVVYPGGPDTTDRDTEDIASPYMCGSCAVDVYCNGNAPSDETGCDQGFAIAHIKDSNNVVPICLPDSSDVPSGYLLFHELIHAQQFCKLKPEEAAVMDARSCCAMETPAYHAQCNAMAEDGVFDGTDITVNLCTSVLTNYSCEGQFGQKCSVTETGAIVGMTEQILQAIEDNTPSYIARTCEEAINNMDQRSRMIINSLPDVCDPQCRAQYENTIGNNACYVAQCIEQTAEEGRLYPGRVNFVAGDQAFPWDFDGNEDKMYGTLMTMPTLYDSRFPDYKPGMVVKELDLALCQINEKPITSPTQECSINLIEQIALGASDASFSGIGYLNKFSRFGEESIGRESYSSSVGARIGTALYTEYFDTGVRGFWELIRNAVNLVGGIGMIEFPSDMCPRLAQ